jgi:hypothetical protein
MKNGGKKMAGKNDGKTWRENFCGKKMAGKKWREKNGGKKMEGKKRSGAVYHYLYHY